MLGRTGARVRIAARVGLREAMRLNEGAPELAARELLGRRDMPGAFQLLDAMLAIGQSADPGVGDGPVLEGPAPFPVSSAFGPAVGTGERARTPSKRL